MFYSKKRWKRETLSSFITTVILSFHEGSSKQKIIVYVQKTYFPKSISSTPTSPNASDRDVSSEAECDVCDKKSIPVVVF